MQAGFPEWSYAQSLMGNQVLPPVPSVGSDRYEARNGNDRKMERVEEKEEEEEKDEDEDEEKEVEEEPLRKKASIRHGHL